MRRILIFNDSMQMGGTEKLLLSFLDYLIEKGCLATLLLPQQSDKDILIAQINKEIEVKYIFAQNTSYLKRKCAEALLIFSPSLFNLLFKIKYNDYDTIICFKDSYFAPIFAQSKAEKILWIHNILYKRHYEIRSLKERIAVWLNKNQLRNMYKAYKTYDSIVCVSKACKKAFVDIVYKEFTPNTKIEIIHNGIDFGQIISKSEEFEAKSPKVTPNFILITRNTPEKRIDRLLYAAQKLHDDGYIFHVDIIGDVNTDELASQIDKTSLNSIITLHGQINNPLPYISKSDWLLCVSERESFGLTLLEAMALDVPVITTDCGGPSDIVGNSKYGLIVENNSEGVYKGMRMVLDNPTLSEHYKVTQKSALQSFSKTVWLKKIDTLLNL